MKGLRGQTSRENEKMPRKPEDKSDKRGTKSSGFLVKFDELYAGGLLLHFGKV
jgi:hypothetical protein